MCGIYGQFNFKSHEPVALDHLKEMTRHMIHRGPDDEGYYVSGSLGLGFRRLSIIDLDGGHQPMSDQEQTVWVVFNGEIYNFPELKKELQSHGHVFRNKSDTEVIVHGYKQWGTSVFEHLNGMFGVAIWDDRRRRLIIARDRMGIKFVYYKLQTDRIYFSSEIRSLLPSDKSRTKFDPEAIYLFLRYRFTPSPLTIYKGIRKLAPGTLIIADQDGSVKIERWWNHKALMFDPIPTDDQAEEELMDLYAKAVKRHLISDVPVGLLLSGGVDSALLLALMKGNSDVWPTYTVGYGTSFKDDELVDAARTAKILNSPNYEVAINSDIFESSLSKIISIVEEPIAASSIVPMYYVCELARRDVKVALVGQGPDELFGGYTRHYGARYGNYWRAIPDWARNLIKPPLSLMPRFESVKRGLYSLDINDRMSRYQNIFSLMSGESMKVLFKNGVLPDEIDQKIIECWGDLGSLLEGTDELGGLQFLEIYSTLPDELLLYADKISMHFGLELRVPYLDKEIVDYVQRLPASFKIRKLTRKWLHKRVSKKLLPDEIISRKKRGFAVNVVDEWFRKSLSHKFDTILLDGDSFIYEYLQLKSVEKLLSAHQNGLQDNHKILFSLVVLEEFLRRFKA